MTSCLNRWDRLRIYQWPPFLQGKDNNEGVGLDEFEDLPFFWWDRVEVFLHMYVDSVLEVCCDGFKAVQIRSVSFLKFTGRSMYIFYSP